MRNKRLHGKEAAQTAADQPQCCRAYELTARLCGRAQLLVSMDDKTRLFPSLLGIQHKVGWSMRIQKTISILVSSASTEEDHG